MFIIVIGTRCAGKTTLADYLIAQKQFTLLRLSSTASEEHLDESSDDKSTVKFFHEPKQLLQFITLHWKQNFVTEDIQDRTTLDVVSRRPSVLIVRIDAPILVRYNRQKILPSSLDLEEFIEQHDSQAFGQDKITASSLHGLTPVRNIQVLNPYKTKEEFYSTLESHDLLNPEHLRPSWDTYFMTLASLASLRSNCMKRRVGALLVKDFRIVSTGYNGTPRGLMNCKDDGCPRCNNPRSEAFDECLCLHAEENALLEAGRARVDNGPGAVLYCNTCPCLRCTIKIIQVGVKEVVYNFSYKMDRESARLFHEAGVELRQYSLT